MLIHSKILNAIVFINLTLFTSKNYENQENNKFKSNKISEIHVSCLMNINH